MSAEYLMSCPFCGSKRLNVCRTNANACWIECAECLAQTDSRKTRRGAINVWNNRVHSDYLPFDTTIVEDDDEPPPEAA